MKKITILIITLLSFGTIITAQIVNNEFFIDINKNDKINISQIAESIVPIPLNFIDMNEPFVEKVVLTPTSIFVQISGKIDSDLQTRIYQLNRNGVLIKKITYLDTKSKKTINPLAIFYDEVRKEIYTIYNEFLLVADKDGKIKRKIEMIQSTRLIQIYNNKLWSIIPRIDMKNQKVKYELTSIDLSTFNLDTLFQYNYTFSKERIFAGTTFSVANKKLYFTNDYENEIISIDSYNKISYDYKFCFSGNDKKIEMILAHPQTVVFKNYIKYGYRFNNGTNCCYFIDKGNGKKYNIRLLKNDKGIMISGFFDNILNTGYCEIQNIDESEYAYFIKNGIEVFKLIKDIKDEFNPVLFLIKLKNSKN